ncbi:MAG TPA: hypothetical protein PKZ84_19720 [Anaerolineae bacterium]|nr:hypothetical protein [Anaerolineae bacterium]HQI86890.1 hypothetical protein [Anaerolineae bacterium]
MKLPIIGYNIEHVRNAQWDIITVLHQGLANHAHLSSAVQQLLHDLLNALPEMDTPVEYAQALAKTVVATIAKARQQCDDSPDSYRTCQEQRQILQMQVDYYHKNPLQEQLRERVEQINRWQSRAKEAEAENAEIKASLAREQRANQARQNRLEGEIAELHRLVVEQQETINAYRK